MKTTVAVWGMVFLGFLSVYSQEPVDYTVRHKPLPIHDQSSGKVLTRVPRNRTIALSSYDQKCDCFLAKYLEFEGILLSGAWLNDLYAKTGKKSKQADTISDSIRRLLTEYKLANDKAADGVFTIERTYAATDTDLKRTTGLVNKWGYTNGKRIAEGKLWLGMTVEMTLESWGIPYRVNRSNGSWGKREQWIYSEAYLYFENGVLSEIYRLNSN